MVEATHRTRDSLTPPLTETEQLAWLRLLRSRRVGAATFYRLIDEHGSAAAALDALPAIAGAAGVSGYAVCPESVAVQELRAAGRCGARLIARGDDAYPTRLCDLADAPPLLWAIGEAGLLARPLVALVGARSASSLGARTARRLARELGEAGFAVVSGLARGIDAAAHDAALPTGTIAVMAGGVDVVYPAENAPLAEMISERGLRLSEQPMHLGPQARHFPRRNRLVSGLAQAVVVVEAAAKSGSLITARTGLDQGREVMAVPGHPFDARAAGCNMLIRDGATLVRGAADVIEALAPLGADRLASPGADQADTPASPARRARPPGQSASNLAGRMRRALSAPGRSRPAGPDAARLHADILARLGPSPLAEDQLIRDLALPAGAVAPALLALELDGRILRQPGGLLSRLD